MYIPNKYFPYGNFSGSTPFSPESTFANLSKSANKFLSRSSNRSKTEIEALEVPGNVGGGKLGTKTEGGDKFLRGLLEFRDSGLRRDRLGGLGDRDRVRLLWRDRLGGLGDDRLFFAEKIYF